MSSKHVKASQQSPAMSTTAGTKRKATTDKKGSKGWYAVPWVEKYRPRTLDDVVGNEDTLVRLRAIAEDGNMPNLILCGPPGTGKVCSERLLLPFAIYIYTFRKSCWCRVFKV